MSIASLADRIRANRKSRSPVQDTVDELFDEISEAIKSGGSFRAIYAQLTREGRNVGKGHNSLFAAYKAVKARRDQSAPTPVVEKTPALLINVGSTAPTLGVSPREMPAVVVDTRRKTTDW